MLREDSTADNELSVRLSHI